MELGVDRTDEQLTRICLSGKLDVAGEQAIGDEFRNLIRSRNTHFLVDLSQVSYMASLGIRLLFAAAKALAQENRKLVILNPQSMVEDVLLTSGTARMIPIAHDEKEALGML